MDAITSRCSTVLCLLQFFLLITRRPPRPTLFPYTTLFRSHPVPPAADPLQLALEPGRPAGDVGAVRLRRRPPDRDRKSTRLNSSHPSISYAVFCLKKKNKHIPNSPIRPHNRSDHAALLVIV